MPLSSPSSPEDPSPSHPRNPQPTPSPMTRPHHCQGRPQLNLRLCEDDDQHTALALHMCQDGGLMREGDFTDVAQDSPNCPSKVSTWPCMDCPTSTPLEPAPPPTAKVWPGHPATPYGPPYLDHSPPPTSTRTKTGSTKSTEQDLQQSLLLTLTATYAPSTTPPADPRRLRPLTSPWRPQPKHSTGPC